MRVLALILIVLIAFAVGCTSPSEQVEIDQSEVSISQVTDQALAGWVEEDSEVEIGEMV